MAHGDGDGDFGGCGQAGEAILSARNGGRSARREATSEATLMVGGSLAGSWLPKGLKAKCFESYYCDVKRIPRGNSNLIYEVLRNICLKHIELNTSSGQKTLKANLLA